MDKQELEFILQEGEGFKIEFKERLSNIDKDVVAFANAEGGRIFLGVNDNSKITGIDITNKLRSEVQNIARNCDPSIKIKLEKFENILIIEVKEGEDKPYKCKEGFYMRIGANSQKMNRDEIIDFVNEEGKIKFDEQINKELTFPRDFDENRLETYLSKAGISKSISNEKLLREFEALKDSKFTNAGALFFIKNPQLFISHSVFTCVLFKDREGSDIIDRQEIKGNLIEIVEDVMKFVERNTRVAYKFTGKPQRENIYEYSLEAIREAVINSVMHRDYFEKGHNNLLRIFPHRLTITNVWIRPKWFKIGKDTFRRNKIIADLFARIRWIEKIGSGFARMKNYCKKVNAPIFKLDINDKYFRIIFFKSRDYLRLAEKEKTTQKIIEIIKENPYINKKELGVKLGEMLGVKLGENEAEIIRRIIENKFITALELSKHLSISLTAIENNISKLKQKGLLKRIGPAKGGYWEVLNK